MSRPIRVFEPRRLYFITNRTIQARFLMRPSAYVNNLIGGVLARSLDRFDVRLYAFNFLSNHFHCIIDAAEGQLSDFLGYFESNVAREVGRHVRWRDKFWARRFSAEPILDDVALLRCVRYIFAHGEKEGLVDNAELWPGLTCIPELVHGVTRSFVWYDRTAQFFAKQQGAESGEEHFGTRYTLEVTPLPCWQDLDAPGRQAAARQLLEEARTEAAAARENKPSLGVEAILSQDPHATPERPKRTPRPFCHASGREAVAAFKAAYRAVVLAYHEASQRFRDGFLDAVFPPYTYRPPLPYWWRERPAEKPSLAEAEAVA